MRWPATRAAPLSPLWQWFALGRAHLSTPCGRRGGVALLTALQRGDNLFHPLPLRVQILQRLIEVHVPPPFLDRTYHHRTICKASAAEPGVSQRIWDLTVGMRTREFHSGTVFPG